MRNFYDVTQTLVQRFPTLFPAFYEQENDKVAIFFEHEHIVTIKYDSDDNLINIVESILEYGKQTYYNGMQAKEKELRKSLGIEE